MGKYVDFTAEGSGRYVIYMDDVEVSRHNQEREVHERIWDLLLENPDAEIKYVHEYVVMTGLTTHGITLARDLSPSANQPPVVDSTPNPPIFIEGTASQYDMSQHVSDPDGDLLTITIQGILPNGLSFADPNLIYDGLGIPSVSVGHTITVTDPGLLSDISSPFTISIAGQGVMDNAPFVWSAFVLNDVLGRHDIEPRKSIVQHANILIQNALRIGDSTNRHEVKIRFDAMRAINPNAVLIFHTNFKMIEFDTSGGRPQRWMEDLLFDDPANFEKWILGESGNPTRYLGYTTFQGQGLAFDWESSGAIRQAIIERHYDDVNDFGGAESMGHLGVYMMEDTMSEEDISRYPKAEHAGPITAVFTQTEIDIPTYTGVDLTGGPDGSGYTSLVNNENMICLKANRTDGSWERITGHKVINGSTDRIRVDGSPGFSFIVVAADDFTIIRHNGPVSVSRRGEMTEDGRRAGLLDLFARYAAKVLAEDGKVVGVTINGGGVQANKKEAGDAPAFPSSYIGAIEFEHWEEAPRRSLGFAVSEDNMDYLLFHEGGGGSGGGPDIAYDVERNMRSVGYNQLFHPSSIASASGYPGQLLNCQIRNLGGTNNLDYSGRTSLDAAWGRFWCLFCWVQENMIPNLEGNMGHSDPVMIDEMIISPGNRITVPNFGTYNPSDPTPTSKGVFTWFTPLFGTYGFFFDYENLGIGINLRPPTNMSIPWIPSWMSGGQPIVSSLDELTMPILSGGLKWRAFNPLTYTNPDVTSRLFGKGPTDFDTSFILRDLTVNNDLDIGLTHNIGALEAQVFMKVPI